jgi:hypothetical protein
MFKSRSSKRTESMVTRLYRAECRFIKSFSWQFQKLLSLIDDLLVFQLAAGHGTLFYGKAITDVLKMFPGIGSVIECP